MANQKENLNEVNQLLERTNKLIAQIAENSKKAFTEIGDPGTLSEIEKLEKGIDDLNKSTDEYRANQKKIEQNNKRLRQGQAANAKEVAKGTEAIRKQNLANRQSAKIDNAKSGSLNRLRAQLAQARARFDDLSRAERDNAKIGGRLLTQIQALDKEVRDLEQSTGRAQRNVGNYKDALGGLSPNLAQVATGTGAIVVGAQLLGGAIRSGIDVVKNFNQAQADLAAISGKSKEELTGLTEQAKLLGGTTQFTATEITQLQTELAKLGFSTDQISEATGGIADFAAATGADLASAAALGGSALRSFGLEASEIDRVVSTLGVATTKSALDFQKLETGLSTVAPVAASFGFSIEDTTALLGQLSNAGFDASSAATATRNILLNLADANGDLAKQLGRPIKSADDLAAGLQELQARGIDLGEALELTDKRSVAAFNTFIQGSDELVGLRDSITDVNDELQLMAEKRLDSIEGQMTLLSSAWEGFVLSLEDGTGPLAEISKIILNDIAVALQQMTDATGEAGDQFSLLGSIITQIRVGWELFMAPIRLAKALFMEIVDIIGDVVGGFAELLGITDSLSFSTDGFLRTFNRMPLIISTTVDHIIMALRPLSDAFKGVFTLDFDLFTDAIRRSNEAMDALPATIEALFNSTKKGPGFFSQLTDALNIQTMALDDNTKATDNNAKSKQKASDDAFKIFVANEKRRISLLEEGILKDLELENLRNLQEVRQAEKNKEDLELVEDVHQQKLREIRDKYREEEFEAERAAVESRRKLNTESGDQLLKELEDQRKKEEEERAARLKAEQETQDAILRIVDSALKARSERRLEALRDEEEAYEEQQSKLEELAAQGDQNALASLELAQKREAQLRREQQEELQRQKQIEAGLAAFKILAAKTEAGDENAYGNTTKEILALETFIRSLPGFYEGADRVGDQLTPQLKGKDGHVIRADGEEMIFNPNQSKKLRSGGRKRSDVLDIMDKYDRGILMEVNRLPSIAIEQERFQSNEEVIRKYDEMIDALNRLPKKMPKTSIEKDAFTGNLRVITKRGNNIVRNLIN